MPFSVSLRLRWLPLVVGSLGVAGCGSDAPSGNVASGGGGSTSAAGATSSGATSGSGGTAASGANATGGSGGDAGGSPSGGGGGDAGSGSDPFTDPGSAGDGDFTIQGPYKSSPNNYPSTPATFGKQIMFTMQSADSTIYPGIKGAYSRKVWLYVPSKYVPSHEAPFLVVQDGYFALWFGNDLPHAANPSGPNLPGTANIPLIVENLVSQGKLPPLVVLLVDNGGGDAEGSQRGLEYDTVSGKYAEFIQTEVLPRAVAEAKTQLQLDLACSAAAPAAPPRSRWPGSIRTTSRASSLIRARSCAKLRRKIQSTRTAAGRTTTSIRSKKPRRTA
jgi:hypothetical protein